MLIHLHKQATTTPKVRAAIQASGEPASALAARFGTTEQTVYKWKHRDSVHDRSHTPHRLQTTLTPAQEAVAVALRTTLLVSLDDLLAVVREFLNPNASRSGLDRCLRRHGVGNLRDLKAKAPTPKHSAFKAYEPGYIHIDVKYLPQMADEASRRYLFVAIDRATRWVFIRVFKAKTAANARRFLRDLERACPLRIRTILTDNGKEFTDRLFGLRKRAATGEHEFGKLCAALDIEHRLTPPKSPQTNGMVERFNGRIEEVLQSHHFRSGEELETTLHRYVWLYNQQLPQSALGSKTPLQAMKDWHKLKPELFKKQPYYLTGCDTYAMVRDTNAIFLLDEPESHFNPIWRVKFFQRLLDMTGNRGNQEVLLTTHAPFVPSDMPREQVMIFSRRAETGKVDVLEPSIETFGATFDRILEACFNIRPPNSFIAEKQIEELLASDNVEKIEAGFQELGPSTGKAVLADHLRKLKNNIA